MLAAPYWEARAPRDWDDDEVTGIFNASPWTAEMKFKVAVGESPSVPCYLATARPLRMAEEEMRRRELGPPTEFDDGDDEYREFLKQNQGKVIVLAVLLPPGTPLVEADIQRIEQKSQLVIGKRKYKIEGHFPPAAADRYLRLVFPREVAKEDQELIFQLYLPVPAPFREARFTLSELKYQGTPEF